MFNLYKEFLCWCNGLDQNRNRIVFSMYADTAKELSVTITIKFLKKRYTQNEGDSVHCVTEKVAEHKTIYFPK